MTERFSVPLAPTSTESLLVQVARWAANDLAGQHNAPSAIDLFRGAAGEPDEWQVQAITSEAPRMLLNCSRQSGKSTVAAVIAVVEALTRPRSLTLMLSPSQRQSGELFRKWLDVYEAAGRPVPAARESAMRIELLNGSRVVSLPGKEKTVRGFSGADLLLIDEAARVDDGLYYAVRPMMAVSEGRLIALSTPFGTRGWWYEAWTKGEDWERYKVTAEECPRITVEFLAEEKRTMIEWWYRQEYLCEFLDAQDRAFSRADVDRAFREVEQWVL